jgi:hypothetical protein
MVHAKEFEGDTPSLEEPKKKAKNQVNDPAIIEF